MAGPARLSRLEDEIRPILCPRTTGPSRPHDQKVRAMNEILTVLPWAAGILAAAAVVKMGL